MKQAIGWYIEALITLGIIALIWLVAIPIVIYASADLPKRKRTWLIGLTVASFPLYLVFSFIYPPLYLEWNAWMHKRIVHDSYQKFLAMCAVPASIEVTTPISNEQPVDIQIIVPETLYGLRVTYFQTGRPVCWMLTEDSRCRTANIGSIEWKYRTARGLKCDSTQPPKGCEWQYFQYYRKANRPVRVEKLHAKYGLVVSESTFVAPMVERFEVSIQDLQDKRTLAKTHLFRRSAWAGGELTSKELARAPITCPDRDFLIADLLSRTFPLPNEHASKTGDVSR